MISDEMRELLLTADALEAKALKDEWNEAFSGLLSDVRNGARNDASLIKTLTAMAREDIVRVGCAALAIESHPKHLEHLQDVLFAILLWIQANNDSWKEPAQRHIEKN